MTTTRTTEPGLPFLHGGLPAETCTEAPVWLLWTACTPAPPPLVSFPEPVGEAAALRLTAARTYLETLERSTGDPPDRLVQVLGDAGTAVADGDPAARALLGCWLLDAEVRRATRDERGLRDVVSAAPSTTDLGAWHAAAEEVAGEPLGRWIEQDTGAGRLDYGVALHWFGVAWQDDRPDHRVLVADPGAQPIARQRRQRWR